MSIETFLILALVAWVSALSVTIYYYTQKKE